MRLEYSIRVFSKRNVTFYATVPLNNVFRDKDKADPWGGVLVYANKREVPGGEDIERVALAFSWPTADFGWLL